MQLYCYGDSLVESLLNDLKSNGLDKTVLQWRQTYVFIVCKRPYCSAHYHLPIQLGCGFHSLYSHVLRLLRIHRVTHYVLICCFCLLNIKVKGNLYIRSWWLLFKTWSIGAQPISQKWKIFSTVGFTFGLNMTVCCSFTFRAIECL